MVLLRRLCAATLSVLSLGSCAYAYSLRAVVIDGRLAFVVAPWSKRHPDCMRGVVVSIDEGGPIAKPAPGDDAALVQNGGVYWWKQFDLLSCPNSFPIFYGQSLKGTPFVRSEEHTSELQSLMRISYAVFCLKKKNKDTY